MKKWSRTNPCSETMLPFDRKELRLDWLLDPSCCFYQHPKHFCTNTDSALLAGFVQAPKKARILEIGCNNAALLLYLQKLNPAFLMGVELHSQAALLGALNMSSFAQADWQIVCEDIRSFAQRQKCGPDQEFSGGFDVILSNPPFFDEDSSLKPSGADLDDSRNMGRFSRTLSLDELAQSVNLLLRDNGRFYLVHRPEKLFEICQIFAAQQLFPCRMQMAADGRTHQIRSVLLCFSRFSSRQLEILPSLSIERKGIFDAWNRKYPDISDMDEQNNCLPSAQRGRQL